MGAKVACAAAAPGRSPDAATAAWVSYRTRVRRGKPHGPAGRLRRRIGATVAARGQEEASMNIYQLIGRNIEITDAMRSYAEDKLQKLNRFSDQIVDARVVMSYDERIGGEPARVEVQVNVPNGMVRAEERGVDTYAAVDLVVDKLERQLKRHKARQRGHRNETPPAAEIEAEDEREPAIVRTKRYVMRPMSPEDAAIEMDDLGHAFYVFRNVDTDLISVIYLRHDGDYGLIEPAR
jgi:putative sigma-54 modulation protein